MKQDEACTICSGRMADFGRAFIMQQHDVVYFRCETCGFVQTEEPYWLDEAYSDAITGSDIGLVSRNRSLSCVTQSIIRACFDANGKFLDYAGGYGLLVRLMRDSGYDFYWYDKYCKNLFAQGFTLTPEVSHRFEMITAYEVLEHLYDPFDELEAMLKNTKTILFTTEIIPPENPKPGAWWYYGLDHGQHISFYTIAALNKIAERLQLNFYTNGVNIHAFTERKLSPTIFRLATVYRFATVYCNIFKRKSLLMTDFAGLAQTGGKAQP